MLGHVCEDNGDVLADVEEVVELISALVLGGAIKSLNEARSWELWVEMKRYHDKGSLAAALKTFVEEELNETCPIPELTNKIVAQNLLFDLDSNGCPDSIEAPQVFLLFHTLLYCIELDIQRTLKKRDKKLDLLLKFVCSNGEPSEVFSSALCPGPSDSLDVFPISTLIYLSVQLANEGLFDSYFEFVCKALLKVTEQSVPQAISPMLLSLASKLAKADVLVHEINVGTQEVVNKLINSSRMSRSGMLIVLSFLQYFLDVDQLFTERSRKQLGDLALGVILDIQSVRNQKIGNLRRLASEVVTSLFSSSPCAKEIGMTMNAVFQLESVSIHLIIPVICQFISQLHEDKRSISDIFGMSADGNDDIGEGDTLQYDVASMNLVEFIILSSLNHDQSTVSRYAFSVMCALGLGIINIEGKQEKYRFSRCFVMAVLGITLSNPSKIKFNLAQQALTLMKNSISPSRSFYAFSVTDELNINEVEVATCPDSINPGCINDNATTNDSGATNEVEDTQTGDEDAKEQVAVNNNVHLAELTKALLECGMRYEVCGMVLPGHGVSVGALALQSFIWFLHSQIIEGTRWGMAEFIELLKLIVKHSENVVECVVGPIIIHMYANGPGRELCSSDLKKMMERLEFLKEFGCQKTDLGELPLVLVMSYLDKITPSVMSFFDDKQIRAFNKLVKESVESLVGCVADVEDLISLNRIVSGGEMLLAETVLNEHTSALGFNTQGDFLKHLVVALEERSKCAGYFGVKAIECFISSLTKLSGVFGGESCDSFDVSVSPLLFLCSVLYFLRAVEPKERDKMWHLMKDSCEVVVACCDASIKPSASFIGMRIQTSLSEGSRAGIPPDTRSLVFAEGNNRYRQTERSLIHRELLLNILEELNGILCISSIVSNSVVDVLEMLEDVLNFSDSHGSAKSTADLFTSCCLRLLELSLDVEDCVLSSSVTVRCLHILKRFCAAGEQQQNTIRYVVGMLSSVLSNINKQAKGEDVHVALCQLFETLYQRGANVSFLLDTLCTPLIRPMCLTGGRCIGMILDIISWPSNSSANQYTVASVVLEDYVTKQQKLAIADARGSSQLLSSKTKLIFLNHFEEADGEDKASLMESLLHHLTNQQRGHSTPDGCPLLQRGRPSAQEVQSYLDANFTIMRFIRVLAARSIGALGGKSLVSLVEKIVFAVLCLDSPGWPRSLVEITIETLVLVLLSLRDNRALTAMKVVHQLISEGCEESGVVLLGFALSSKLLDDALDDTEQDDVALLLCTALTEISPMILAASQALQGSTMAMLGELRLLMARTRWSPSGRSSEIVFWLLEKAEQTTDIARDLMRMFEWDVRSYGQLGTLFSVHCDLVGLDLFHCHSSSCAVGLAVQRQRELLKAAKECLASCSCSCDTDDTGGVCHGGVAVSWPVATPTNNQQKFEQLKKIQQSVRSNRKIVICGSLLTEASVLGSIARYAEIFAISKLVVPSRDTPTSPGFRLTSVSAETWLDIKVVPREGLFSYLRRMRTRGYCVVGVSSPSQPSPDSLRQCAVHEEHAGGWEGPGKLVFLLGNEESGLGVYRNMCDTVLTIPRAAEKVCDGGGCRDTLLHDSNSNSSMGISVVGAIVTWEGIMKHGDVSTLEQSY